MKKLCEFSTVLADRADLGSQTLFSKLTTISPRKTYDNFQINIQKITQIRKSWAPETAQLDAVAMTEILVDYQEDHAIPEEEPEGKAKDMEVLAGLQHFSSTWELPSPEASDQ